MKEYTIEEVIKEYRTITETIEFMSTDGRIRIFPSKNGLRAAFYNQGITGEEYLKIDAKILIKKFNKIEKPVTREKAIQAWLEGKTVRVEYNSNKYIQYYDSPFGYLQVIGIGFETINNGFPRVVLEKGEWYIRED